MAEGFGKLGMDVKAARAALAARQAAPAVSQKRRTGTVAKVALYSVIVVVGAFVGLVGMAISEGTSAARTLPVPTKEGWTVVSTDKITLQRPAEPQATYTIIGVAKTADGKVVAMNTRYSRQTGWVYTMRAYDCENGKLFTLGSGETFEEMQVYRPDTQWGQLIQGSSATQVAAISCRKTGKSLSGVK